MTDAETSSSQETRPAQFSLGTAFVVTTTLAFVLALVFVIPYWLAGPAIVILMLAIPGVLIVCARYGSALAGVLHRRAHANHGVRNWVFIEIARGRRSVFATGSVELRASPDSERGVVRSDDSIWVVARRGNRTRHRVATGCNNVLGSRDRNRHSLRQRAAVYRAARTRPLRHNQIAIRGSYGVS